MHPTRTSAATIAIPATAPLACTWYPVRVPAGGGTSREFSYVTDQPIRRNFREPAASVSDVPTFDSPDGLPIPAYPRPDARTVSGCLTAGGKRSSGELGGHGLRTPLPGVRSQP